MEEGISKGRRDFLKGATLAGAGVLGGVDAAQAKVPDPKTAPLEFERKPAVRREILREPHTDFYDDSEFDSFQTPSQQIECNRLSDAIEVDAKIIDALNADPEYFYLNPATGSLRVASFRNGKPEAQPIYEGALDIRTVEHIRVVGLPEGNGVHLTVVFKDNHRQRLVIRRDFFGDHHVNVEEPARLMNYPGERKQT